MFWDALFANFAWSVRKMSHHIMLSNMVDLPLGTADDSLTIRKLSTAHGNVYPNGIFDTQEPKSADGQILIWGVTNESCWCLWRVMFDGKSPNLRRVEHVDSQRSFSHLFHAFVKAVPQGTPYGCWDAINLALAHLIKKRTDAISAAAEIAEGPAFLNGIVSARMSPGS